MRIYVCATILIVLSSVCAYTQIPKGSILHLQGDVAITETAGKITQWRDTNSPAKTFFAPLAGNQPTSPTRINGHKAVRFDGVANYLEGPSIYPAQKDYTITIAVRVINFGLNNNVVSGTTHALWLRGTPYPALLHGDFGKIASASIAVDTATAIVTAIHNHDNGQGIFYVNGVFADSAFVGVNLDSTVFLGAYQRGNFFGGDLAEVVLYDRKLNEIERSGLEATLMTKYNIPKPPPPPPIDQTFTALPRPLELYPRSSDDSATVAIKGTLTAVGYDSIYVKVLRNFGPYKYYSAPLVYGFSGASFSFAPRIHAELSEYSFIVGVKSSAKDSILRRRDSILCGDVYFVTGQSNSIFGGESYTSEYCRTFGVNWSQSKRDTLWALSSASGNGGGTSVGAWAMRLHKHLLEDLGIPSVIISGGVGGTAIESHLRNNNDPFDMRTIYGSMLFRATNSRLGKYAKAMFWYQGESNTVTNYANNFESLYAGWRLDYPALKKIYVLQFRPGCLYELQGPLRDLLRSLNDSLPDIVPHTTMGLPEHDGCHFRIPGYRELGDELSRLVMRDFYQSTDTIGINSPNISKAYFTDSQHQTIALIFKTGRNGIAIPNDTIVSSIHASIRDYLYVGSDTGLVSNLIAKGDTLWLQLSRPSSATTITYLPDQNYNGTKTIYEGPWLTNKRGLGAFSFWKFPLTENLQSAPSFDSPSDESVFMMYPNPSTQSVNFIININKRSHLRLTLYDEIGREIIRPVDEIRDEGNYHIGLDTRPLGGSAAIVRLEIDGRSYEKRLVIVH